jgi:GT2 family glycosyltransferase
VDDNTEQYPFRKNAGLNIEHSGDARIALIIVNYHSAGVLRRCLQCVAAQQVRPAQVIVIDNGDELGALDFVAQDHPNVELIGAENIGFAAANNFAVGHAGNSEWIALLNPDAFPEPDWLEKLIIAAQQNPDADMFSSHLVNANNPLHIDGDGDSYHFSGLAWRFNHGRQVADHRTGGWVFSPCAAAAMYRRQALLDINGFDENFFCYFEDVDLGFRLQLRGYRCLHVADAVVSHVGGSSSAAPEMSDFALYHGHRNLVWTFVKNMPGYLFWLFLPAHLAMNIVSIIWFALRGKGQVIVRAKIDAIRRLPEVWVQRRQIQSTRTISPYELLKSLSFWPRR